MRCIGGSRRAMPTGSTRSVSVDRVGFSRHRQVVGSYSASDYGYRAASLTNSGKNSAAVRSFLDWLEAGLDDFGLDSVLYSRCILSVLREPPDNYSEEDIENEIELSQIGSTGESFAVIRSIQQHVHSPPYNNNNNNQPERVQMLALLGILKTVDIAQTVLKQFVREVLVRYADLRENYEKPTEGCIDSGVCPSPAESLQDYDEAFPPLSDGSCAEVQQLTSMALDNVWLCGRSTAPQPPSSEITVVRPPASITPQYYLPAFLLDGDQYQIGVNNNSSVTRKRQRKSSSTDENSFVSQQFSSPSLLRNHFVASFLVPHAPPIGGGLGAFTRVLSRPLRSCPIDWVRRRYGRSLSGSLLEGRVTSAGQPPYKKSLTALGHSPQFIVPKCYKVGAPRPSAGFQRYECKAPDTPFRQCTEWMCPVHSSMFQQYQQQPVPFSVPIAIPPPRSEGQSMHYQRLLGESTATGGGSMISTSLGSATSSGSFEMFDAPRFILHIINEDETADADVAQALQKKPKRSPVWLSPSFANVKTTNVLKQQQHQQQLHHRPHYELGVETNWPDHLTKDPPVPNEMTWGEMPQFAFMNVAGERLYHHNGGGSLAPIVQSPLNNNNVLAPSNQLDAGASSFCLPKFDAADMGPHQLPPLVSSGPTDGFMRQTTCDVDAKAFEPSDFRQDRAKIATLSTTHFIPIKEEPDAEEIQYMDDTPWEGWDNDEKIAKWDAHWEKRGYLTLRETRRQPNGKSLPLRVRVNKPEKSTQTDWNIEDDFAMSHSYYEIGLDLMDLSSDDSEELEPEMVELALGSVLDGDLSPYPTDRVQHQDGPLKWNSSDGSALSLHHNRPFISMFDSASGVPFNSALGFYKSDSAADFSEGDQILPYGPSDQQRQPVSVFPHNDVAWSNVTPGMAFHRRDDRPEDIWQPIMSTINHTKQSSCLSCNSYMDNLTADASDREDDEQLLRYVSNISLISPLEEVRHGNNGNDTTTTYQSGEYLFTEL